MLLESLGQLFTFQTFGDREKSNKLVKVIHGTLEECRPELERLNQQGAGVFFTVNETDGRGRQESNITRVRALFADFDIVDHDRQFDYFLQPSYVVESSPGKHHAYWILSDELPLHLFKQYQGALAELLDSDPKICDLPRVMRVPGFIHSKQGPFMVREVAGQGRTYTVEELKKWLWIDDEIATVGGQQAGSSPSSVTVDPIVYVKDCPEAAVRFRELVLDLSLAGEGERNNTLNRVAFEAYGYVRAGRLYKEDVYNALIECSVDIGLTEDEAATTINSAIKKSKPIFSALQLLPDLPDAPETDQDASELNKIGTPILWFDQIENERPDWLWKDYLCRRSLHTLTGDGGVGKSNICVNLAAIVSRGGVFPDGQQLDKPMKVIYFTTEDDVRMTVRPRLEAAGANMQNVGIMNKVKTSKGEVHFNPAKHMPQLIAACKSTGYEIGLVIIDPIVAAVEGDHNKNEEVRRGLEPVLHMAQELNCAVVGITHFGKSKGGTASARMLGSTAFSAVARITLFAMAVEESDGHMARYFVKGKSNISKSKGGFKFDLNVQSIGDIEEITCVKWREYIDRGADDILEHADQTSEEKSAMTEAKEFLIESLAGGSRNAKALEREASALGISKSTLNRARKDLKIITHKTGFGGSGSWEWELPQSNT